MPSMLHEAVLLLFRNRPTLAAELLRDVFHLPIPSFSEAQIVSADLTEVIPAEHRSDLVILFHCEGASLAVVIEAQLHRDPDKRYSWPVYVAGVRARYRCPVLLLVVTIDPALAAWCATTIEMGHPGHTLTPLVLGPEVVPIITDVEQARLLPELAVLSAMAHGHSDAGEAIGKAFLTAAAIIDLDGIDPERSSIYSDLVVAFLNEAARRSLEAMMKGGYVYQTELVGNWVKKGLEEGLQQGLQQGRQQGLREGILQARAQDVLAILESRGLPVPPEVRARVLGSTDLAELDTWIRRAAVVTDALALLAARPNSSVRPAGIGS